jgi:TRAP-type mannitol/chloroaromatic compound transport system permease small subunit
MQKHQARRHGRPPSWKQLDMQNVLYLIDRVNTWIGHAFAWLILALTLQVSWEVFSRYVLNQPNAWAFDLMIMMYGTAFMMAGAYTLAKDGHVRGDVLYGFFPPRLQASLDLALYILFFIPGIVALIWAGYDYAAESWAIQEHSTLTANGPPLYPFKTVIPIAGILLIVQGVGEIARCVICIKRGEWPPREGDVKEVDVDQLKGMVYDGGKENVQAAKPLQGDK